MAISSRARGRTGTGGGRRRADGGGEDARVPLFTFNGRTPVNPCTASQAFHHLMPASA